MIPRYEQTHRLISLRLFEAIECEEIVGKLSQIKNWKDALVRDESRREDYSDVKNPDIRSASMPNTEEVVWLYRKFEQRIDSLVKPLVQKVWKLNLDRQSDTQLLKYEAGGHYRPHKDTGIGLEKRYLSVVCYLNDDFEGGRTLFPTLGQAVTPQAGQAVLFPSMYLHGSEPVISGRKYVLVSWIDGPVPIKWI
jgi:Rps23 Pro-64 3,4-dihydroxylase Tpa1-like proline 4-hydroxylase